MRLLKWLRKRKPAVDDDHEKFLRRLNKEQRKRKRKERRQRIVDRLTKLAGLFTGHAFGLNKVGWILSGLTLAAGLIAIWKYLL